MRCILLASVPALFWMWVYYRRDRWEPEPKRLVAKLFFLGALVAVPVWYLEGWLPLPPGDLLDCFVRVSLTEELFKVLPVLAFACWHRQFNEPMDGIIYAVAAALGFATVENVIYAIRLGDKMILYRAFTSTLAHVGFSGVIGYKIGVAKFVDRGGGWIIARTFLAIVVLHGAYDLMLAHSTRPGASELAARVTIFAGVAGTLGMLSWAVHLADKQSPFRRTGADG